MKPEKIENLVPREYLSVKPPEQFILRLKGKPFRCECGANVFQKDDRGRYVCNGCDATYEGK